MKTNKSNVTNTTAATWNLGKLHITFEYHAVFMAVNC
jgi:hypothetical protein